MNKERFKNVLGGKYIKKITDHLNTTDIMTTTGKKWTVENVTAVLNVRIIHEAAMKEIKQFVDYKEKELADLCQ